MDYEIEDLVIEKEFKDLIPKISRDEYNRLEESILDEGVRDKFVVWEKNDKKIILDGHNRYKICSENKLECKIKLKIKHFENREEAIDYIIKNQLARRNLTPDQKRYFIGKLYNENKKEPHRPPKTKAEKGDVIQPLKTAEKFAEKYGSSPTYIKGAGKYAKDYDTIKDKVGSKLTDKLLTGKNKSTVDDFKELAKLEANVIKEVFVESEDEDKKIKNVLKEKKIKEPISKPSEISKKVKKSPPDIHKLKYNKWVENLDDKTIDLLITQPPVKKEEEDKVEFVEEWIPLTFSKIKDTGSAYIFVSPSNKELKIYLDALTDSNCGLNFVGIIAWTFKDTSEEIPIHAKRLTWQQILYLKGKNSKKKGIPTIDRQSSVPHIEIPEGSKINRMYKFQKPDKLIKQLIEFSTKKGDSIIDPFAGAGKFLTTGVELDRKASGCEENEVILEVAEKNGCKII